MGDLLTAAALILTAISIIYGQWIDDINSVLNLEVSSHKADNRKKHSTAKNVLLNKAMPLLIVAILFTLVYLPNVIEILREVFNIKFKKQTYDAIKATFILIELFQIILLCSITKLFFKTIMKVKKLRPD